MSESRRHLGVGALLSVLVQGGPLVAVSVLSVVIARTIGPSGNGRFALIVTLTVLVGMVVSLGLAGGITYEVSRRRWPIRHALRAGYVVALPLGVVGFVGGLAIFEFAQDQIFGGIPTWIAVIALSCLPPVLLYQFADAILLARERYEDYATLELSHSLVLLVVGVSLTIPLGLTGAVIGLPAAAAVGALVGTLLVLRASRGDLVVDGGGSLARSVRFGLQTWGANLLQQVNYRFDILILGGFAAAREVGVYSVALGLTSLAWVLPHGLQTVLFPRTASLDESTLVGELGAADSDASLAKAARHAVLLAAPAGLLISLLLLAGVPLLYGGKFAQTTPLGFVLLPGVLMLGVGKVLTSGIAGRGYPRYILFSGAISAPLTLGLYFILIPRFHAWGAAIGSSISYGLMALLWLYFFRRVTRIGLRAAFVPRAEDVADYGGLARLVRAWRPAR